MAFGHQAVKVVLVHDRITLFNEKSREPDEVLLCAHRNQMGERALEVVGPRGVFGVEKRSRGRSTAAVPVLAAVIFGTRFPTHWENLQRRTSRATGAPAKLNASSRLCPEAVVLIVNSADFTVEFDERRRFENPVEVLEYKKLDPASAAFTYTYRLR
jgi:hypothetical protein